MGRYPSVLLFFVLHGVDPVASSCLMGFFPQWTFADLAPESGWPVVHCDALFQKKSSQPLFRSLYFDSPIQQIPVTFGVHSTYDNYRHAVVTLRLSSPR